MANERQIATLSRELFDAIASEFPSYQSNTCHPFGTVLLNATNSGDEVKKAVLGLKEKSDKILGQLVTELREYKKLYPSECGKFIDSQSETKISSLLKIFPKDSKIYELAAEIILSNTVKDQLYIVYLVLKGSLIVFAADLAGTTDQDLYLYDYANYKGNYAKYCDSNRIEPTLDISNLDLIADFSKYASQAIEALSWDITQNMFPDHSNWQSAVEKLQEIVTDAGIDVCAQKLRAEMHRHAEQRAVEHKL